MVSAMRLASGFRHAGSTHRALLVCVAFLLALPLTACRDSSAVDQRVLVIETREVTSPDVAVSPDGETLVFSLLGHLFRLPEEGGEAEQLTFGPFYDDDPVFSPDGSEIAFASDRGGGEGNLFVLELATGAIRQVTDEYWAARPAWSPDGTSLVYLSYARGSVRCAGKAGIHRVPAAGGSPEILTDRTRVIRSVDFDPNGDLVSVSEERREERDPETGHAMFRSHVERAMPDGGVEVVESIDGRVDRIAAHPREGYLAHRSEPWALRGALVRVSGEGAQTDLVEVTRRYCPYLQPRFDVGPGGEQVYLGDEGKLWRISTLTGARDSIPFVARAEIPVRTVTPAPQTDLGRKPSAPEISFPDRAADGSAFVFGALAKIWLQKDPDVPAESLTGPLGIERMPALAPDGMRVAFVAANEGRQDLVLLDLDSGTRKTLATAPYFWDLAWHPGGERLIVAEEHEFTFIVTSLDVVTGRPDTLVAETGEFFFPPRPHYSSDGSRLFYTVYGDGEARLYGLTSSSGKRDLVATLPDYVSNVQVSPDGARIGFRRNDEVWITPLMGASPQISLESGTLVSETGGRSFRWSGPERVLYSDGESVLEYEVVSGQRHPIPLWLALERSPRRPLVIERAHVLDFDAKGFSREVSLFVRDGAIEQVGDQTEWDLPEGVEHVDAEGRFIIPGLIEPHMHVEAPWWLLEVDQRALLASGVTTMRDVGEPLHWARSLDQRSTLTGTPLPRYLFSGEMLQYYISGKESGGVGYAHSSMLVYDEAAVREAIRQHARRGVQLIKAYASLPMNLHRVVADETHRLGLPVMAHGTSVKEVVRGVLLGYAFLEHLAANVRFFDDLQQLMAQAGTYWTPTLSIMGGTGVLFMPEEERNTRWGEFFRFLQDNELADITAARERGVNVLVGTDNPEPQGVGASLHGEMQAFVLAGYAPLEVLRMATHDAALALGIDTSVGTLKAGKLADFVILNEDPLADITNTRDIWRVVKDGRVYDPADLLPQEREER